MKKLNVLFLMPQMGMGGSERLVHTLVRKVDRSRFRPHVAWMSNHDALEEFQQLDVPLYRVPKRKRVDWRAMHAIGKVVADNDIQVVNAQHFMPAIYAYYGCKVVSRSGLVFTAHSRWEAEESPLKWRVVGGAILRRIDASIGVSGEVTNAIGTIYNIPADKTVTIENGVDVDLFTRDGSDNGLRASLGLSDRNIVLGIVANLKVVKNHSFLLKGFCEVTRNKPDLRLLLVGQGFSGESDNTEDELRRFVDSQGLSDKVLFLGRRTDIAELLRTMDIFCLTSIREGLPLGIIEAMASGLPVIGTNVQGIRNVVTPDVDGILVEPDDVPALAKSIDRLSTDAGLRARLGEAGRSKAVERYSLARCVRAYEQLFESISSRVQTNRG